MERGEIWWALIGERCPVVLLSEGGSSGFRAMQVVAPATADEKRGFLVLTGEEATDPQVVQRAIGASQAAYRAIGIEVKLGAGEGLPIDGVVRVAFPRDGHIYCTWLVTVAPDTLIQKAGELSGTKLDELANALRLAGVE